jgi:hypothetical protein
MMFYLPSLIALVGGPIDRPTRALDDFAGYDG